MMHGVFAEDLGELEEAMKKSFHGYFKKDIRVDNEISFMPTSSFDRNDTDE